MPKLEDLVQALGETSDAASEQHSEKSDDDDDKQNDNRRPPRPGGSRLWPERDRDDDPPQGQRRAEQHTATTSKQQQQPPADPQGLRNILQAETLPVVKQDFGEFFHHLEKEEHKDRLVMQLGTRLPWRRMLWAFLLFVLCALPLWQTLACKLYPDLAKSPLRALVVLLARAVLFSVLHFFLVLL